MTLSRVFLPQMKLQMFHSHVQSLQSSSQPALLFCMRVLGFTVASFEIVLIGHFHSKPLQLNIPSAWNKNFSFFGSSNSLITKDQIDSNG